MCLNALSLANASQIFPNDREERDTDILHLRFFVYVHFKHNPQPKVRHEKCHYFIFLAINMHRRVFSNRV